MYHRHEPIETNKKIIHLQKNYCNHSHSWPIVILCTADKERSAVPIPMEDLGLNTSMCAYMSYFPNFVFYFLFLNSGFVVALNCTSPTPKALMKALETDLFPENLVRPVSSFSEPMNITIAITVVGILGVVSLKKHLFVLVHEHPSLFLNSNS